MSDFVDFSEGQFRRIEQNDDHAQCVYYLYFCFITADDKVMQHVEEIVKINHTQTHNFCTNRVL